MMAAFSRSISPMRPILCESVTVASGTSSRMISAARSSWAELTWQKMPATANEVTPLAFSARAVSATAFSSSATLTRPSN